jgi:hypothetical protein
MFKSSAFKERVDALHGVKDRSFVAIDDPL